MAKKEKAEGNKAETKKTFVVSDLCEALDKEAFEVRALLRRAEVDKVEGKYQWIGQKEFDSVVKKLKALPARSVKAAAEEPAKKAPSKKAEEAAPENKGGKKRPKPAGSK